MTDTQQVPARFEEAVARLDGDVGLLREMAAITSEDLPEVWQQINNAIEAGDQQASASGLHKLKGMLSTFESDGVVLDIQELLDSARRGAMDDLKEGFQQHSAAIRELIGEVHRLASDG